jgi:hypothetical protein
MGIEEDFYATIKLKTGEEIFSKVSVSEEETKTLLILSNPIMVSEIQTKYGVTGYKVEPWLKTSTEDLFIIDVENVLTMSESIDIEMITIYDNYIKKIEKAKSNNIKLDRKMGYLANVDEAKKSLEKLFKIS